MNIKVKFDMFFDENTPTTDEQKEEAKQGIKDWINDSLSHAGNGIYNITIEIEDER